MFAYPLSFRRGQSYYSAPYADPTSQLLYYIASPAQDQYYQLPQRYQYQETNRKRQERDKQPPEVAKGEKTGWGEAPMPPGQMKKYDR